MIIVLALLVALVGLLLYALSANPKVSEIGRIMFFSGLLAFLIRFSAERLHLVGMLSLPAGLWS